jgi:type I restriction enzyme S subunit
MQKLNLTKKYERYPEYKDSGVEWIGEIPKDWRIGKVKGNFKLLKEKSFNNSKMEILSLTLNGIKTRDISNNEGQIASTYEGYRKIIKGDIVLNPMDLVRGFVDSSKYEGIISPAYSTLRKVSSEINSGFYGYFFQKHYFEGIFFPFGNGVSVDHRWTLKDDTLMNFPIVEVSYGEQTKIAAYLDEKTALIDRIIEKKKKQIELLREKRTAVINHAVTKGLDPKAELVESGIDWIGKIPKGWGVEKLTSIARIETGGTPLKSEAGYYASEGLVWAKPADLNEFTPITNSKDRLTSDGAKLARLIPKNSVLVNCIGDVGHMGVAGTELATNQQINSIIFSSKINPNFGKYMVYSSSEEMKAMSNSVVIAILNKSQQGSIRYGVPSKKEQELIAQYLNKQATNLDKCGKVISESIELLKEFKSSLISNVVTGKIKV